MLAAKYPLSHLPLLPDLRELRVKKGFNPAESRRPQQRNPTIRLPHSFHSFRKKSKT
jgi:hypothetical protein